MPAARQDQPKALAQEFRQFAFSHSVLDLGIWYHIEPIAAVAQLLLPACQLRVIFNFLTSNAALILLSFG